MTMPVRVVVPVPVPVVVVRVVLVPMTLGVAGVILLMRPVLCHSLLSP